MDFPKENADFDEARAKILAHALKIAVFDGFTGDFIQKAAQSAGINKNLAHAALPGGVSDLLRFWTNATSAAMGDAAESEDFQSMKIREKVRALVLARIDHLRADKEAARRAAAFLALPHNAALGASLAWDASDAIWRAMKDPSTDFNFYSKRAILAGVWTSTLGRWFADETSDESETRDFLDARIGNVMEFEKAKSRLRDVGIDFKAPIEWLAKMRYAGGRD